MHGRRASSSCDISQAFRSQETAEALGISPATVKREWQMARASLRETLGSAGSR